VGLEAESDIETGGKTYRVKALLESRELIVRGALRRTFAFAAVSGVTVHDGALHFVHDDVDYVLHLPQGRADTWASKLTTPPPSLAAKLGIGPQTPAFVIGTTSDDALDAALTGATTADRNVAAMTVVVAETPDALPDPDVLPALPVWIIYPKGARSSLPESAIRTHMRGKGWTDTKTSAVSDRLTALRFHKR